MIKTLSLASAALFGLAITTGAAAADSKVQPAAEATPAARPTPDKAQSDETKYCVVDTVTGSRIPVKTCKTRAAWMREDGFDPLNP